MGIFRETRVVDGNEVVVRVPDEMVNREIEIIVRTVGEKAAFEAFRAEMKDYEFDREEANSR